MPDPRFSANQIAAKFSEIQSTFYSISRRLVNSEKSVDGLLDVVEMLNARITELEEALDAMEAQQ